MSQTAFFPLLPSTSFLFFMFLISCRPSCCASATLILPPSSTRRISIICKWIPLQLGRPSGMLLYCSFTDLYESVCASSPIGTALQTYLETCSVHSALGPPIWLQWWSTVVAAPPCVLLFYSVLLFYRYVPYSQPATLLSYTNSTIHLIILTISTIALPY